MRYDDNNQLFENEVRVIMRDGGQSVIPKANLERTMRMMRPVPGQPMKRDIIDVKYPEFNDTPVVPPKAKPDVPPIQTPDLPNMKWTKKELQGEADKLKVKYKPSDGKKELLKEILFKLNS